MFKIGDIVRVKKGTRYSDAKEKFGEGIIVEKGWDKWEWLVEFPNGEYYYNSSDLEYADERKKQIEQFGIVKFWNKIDRG